MKIAVIKESQYERFEGDQYEIELGKGIDWSLKRQEGDLNLHCIPFPEIPLELQIAIHPDGTIDGYFDFVNPGYNFHGNQYLHLAERDMPDAQGSYWSDNVPTPEQTDTVNGLFSGRIKYDGLKLAVGATVQKICHIDIEKEEKLIGKRIFLA